MAGKGGKKKDADDGGGGGGGDKKKKKDNKNDKDSSDNSLGFINSRHRQKRTQKMSWTAENDRHLLLFGLGREIKPKDYQAIANSFPEKPTKKAVQERVTKLRQIQLAQLTKYVLSAPERAIHPVGSDEEDEEEKSPKPAPSKKRKRGPPPPTPEDEDEEAVPPKSKKRKGIQAAPSLASQSAPQQTPQAPSQPTSPSAAVQQAALGLMQLSVPRTYARPANFGGLPDPGPLPTRRVLPPNPTMEELINEGFPNGLPRVSRFGPLGSSFMPVNRTATYLPPHRPAPAQLAAPRALPAVPREVAELRRRRQLEEESRARYAVQQANDEEEAEEEDDDDDE